MLFLVLAEARDSIIGDAVPKLRHDVGVAVQRLTASGKMKCGGIVAARRMAALVLEVDSAVEIMDLLGGEIIDNMQVEVQPLVTFEELGAFFAKHPM